MSVVHDVSPMAGKLREFNSKVAESERINENVLESFEHMMAGQAPSAAQLDNLWKALQWPAGNTRMIPYLYQKHTAFCFA
jgi:hypothetical protein